MESLTVWIFALTLGTFLWKVVSKIFKKVPPGPIGLPFLGSIFQLRTASSHIQLTKWAEEYGNIFKFHLMGKDVVVISGEKNIRQVLVHNSDAFAGRPYLNRVSIAHRGGFYISFGDISERWKKLKKLVINNLAMFGGGLHRLEEITMEQLTDMVNGLQMRASNGETFDIKLDIQTVMANIDFTLTCGRRMKKEEIRMFLDAERQVLPLISPSGKGCELDVAPWLKHLPNTTVSALNRIEKENAKIFEPELKERTILTDGQHPCVLDSLLSYNKGTSCIGKLRDIDIRAVVEDLCSAGISTSSSAVYSFLALCVVKPDLQTRLQTEIYEQIGERLPTLSDRSKLPFVEAAILELFRYVSHVPIAVPHKTTREIDLGGFRLQRGIPVLVNLWSLHHNEKYWSNPWSYQPERFLAKDGSLLDPSHPNRKRLLPFGAGRRVCIGETMARSRIFLTIVTLLQKFKFLPGGDGDALPETDPRKFENGIILYTPNYTLNVEPR